MAKEKNKSNRTTALHLKERWKIPREDLVQPNGKSKGKEVDYNKLRALVESNASNINDAKGIMELLPDLILVKEILIASILSPKDLSEVNLNITIDKRAPAEIAELVRVHLSTVYDLDSKLSDILGESLFDVGSYCMLSLPPKIISNIIKEGTYSLEGISTTDFTSAGILATSKGYSMESISIGAGNAADTVMITDNLKYLAKPAITDSMKRAALSSSLESAFGLEGLDDNSELDVYLHRKSKLAKNETLEAVDNNNAFNPIVMHVPSESVIPVFVPGEAENHVGYYIVIDENGAPISKATDANHFKELDAKLNDIVKKGNSNAVVNALGLPVSTKDTDFTKPMLTAYINKIEKELKDAVANGVHGGLVEVGNPDEIYRIMFRRQLENQKTRILYVPAEIMTYVAFNYNESGQGVSLIEKTKLYASLRAVLMFARMIAGVKNSVNHRVLSITLDEQDTDPTGTAETVITEYLALQSANLPLNKLNPTDILDSLQKAGVQIKIDGGNLFPNTSIDVEDEKRDVAMPDDELSDILKRAHYAGLWVTPEAVDSSLEGELATSINSNNLVQAKRTAMVQKRYTAKLSSFIHKYIYSGGPLLAEIKELMTDATDITLEEVINSISVSLPKCDNAVIKAQSEAYSDYEAFIEAAIDLYVNEDSISDLLDGDFTADGIESLRVSILNTLKRQYLRNQNMLPELDNLLTRTDNNLADLISQHNANIVSTIGDVKRKLAKKEFREDKKTNKVIDRLEEDESTLPDSTGAEEDESTLPDGTGANEGLVNDDGIDPEADDSIDPEADDGIDPEADPSASDEF